MFDVGREFHEMLCAIHATNGRLGVIRPTPLSVSTMTIVGKLDATCVPLKHILDHLQEFGDDDIALPLNDKAAKFCNQVTLKCKRMSIKVFGNGKVQVTGCRSAVHFISVMDTLVTFLSRVLDTPPMALCDASIKCINASFMVTRVLPLPALRQRFADLGHFASYTPDMFAGLKVEVPFGAKTVKAVVFRSGSINLTAASTPAQVSDAYATMCMSTDAFLATLDTPAALSVPKNRVTPAIVEDYDIIDGYSFRVFHLCTGVE